MSVYFQMNLSASLAQTTRARIAIGIATVGRPAVLAQLLSRLKAQTRPADAIIICAANPLDFPTMERSPSVIHALAAHGLASQRNKILRQADTFDYVIFFDDDFFPALDYLEIFEQLMLSHPDIIMSTGQVLRDGVRGPGLDVNVADSVLGQAQRTRESDGIVPIYNGYGCNMGIRLEPVRRYGLTFDEQLPLYGWLEDVDFSRQLASFGQIVRCNSTRGVHLGTKQGRQRGVQLGYSQIANPIYLIGKGTIQRRRAVYLMGRNFAANALYSLMPEQWIDRRGRLKGNLQALLDLAVGRLDTRRVCSL